LFLLTELGLEINYEKSYLEPTQRIEYLGLVFNSKLLEVSISARKRDKAI